MKLKSLGSIYRVTNDSVDWLNVDKNIYNEKCEIDYIFKLFGITLFTWGKDSNIKHSLDNETSLKKSSGFRRDQ